MKKVLLAISYIPFLYLVYVYAGHGIEGFFDQESFYEVIQVLGLGGAITTALVLFTGALDTFVAILLVAKVKIMPKLPILYLFIWVGLWPWVPRVMEVFGGLEPEIEDAVLVSVAAALAYIAHIVYHKDSKNII